MDKKAKPQGNSLRLGFLIIDGDDRSRTDDLNTASVALSQLSYAPE